MASNGIKRLKDKHVNKKAEQKRLNALLDSLMQPEKVQDQANSGNENVVKTPTKKKGAKKPAKSPELPHLKDIEQENFDRIWAKLCDIHENPEDYRIIAENTAKMLAQTKRLEEQMEQDGGAILATKDGRLYPHPAMKMIQNYQGQILSHLKALGLTYQGKAGPKKQEEDTASVFAQFQ